MRSMTTTIDPNTQPTDKAAKHLRTPERPNRSAETSGSRWMLPLLKFGLPVVVLAAAGLAAYGLLVSSPEQATAPVDPLVPTVEVLPAEPRDVAVQVSGYGTVVPARDTVLSPEVEGRVIEVSKAVQPGGVVRAGDVLLRLDPAEYRLAVAAAEADLARAEADLELEKGRGMVARQEWERFGDSLGPATDEMRSETLANREPQRRQAEAEVLRAGNAVERARLDVTRTEVKAPFDAVILSESVEVGRQARPGDELMRLAGTATFWIEASVPPRQASRLVGGSLATINSDAGERRGTLIRVLPEVERQGRMARLLVAVADPLSLETEGAALSIGGYVRVTLDGGVAERVVAVPRSAMRENNQVWVRDAAGTLRFRDVRTAWAGEGDALLDADAFQPGDAIITSYLNDPLPGSPVQLREGS
jgi:RND family efflux transporter MFP subunit